jgi:hypothetical protein
VLTEGDAAAFEEAVAVVGTGWILAAGLAALLQAAPPPSIKAAPATTVHILFVLIDQHSLSWI